MTTEQEAFFAVAVESTTPPLQAGETLGVTVAVENTGEGTGTQDVELLDFDEEQVAVHEDLELDSGDAETVTLEWETDVSGAGTGAVLVRSDDESVTEPITIEQAPAQFNVEITRASEHVTEGQTITITATVQNAGSLEGAQKVEIAVNDAVEQSQTLTLDGQAEETIEFTYATAAEDLPDVTVSVSCEDGEDSVTVPVVEESVTPLREIASKSGMGVFGYAMAIVMIILLLPMVPVVVALKLIELLFDSNEPTR